MSSQELARLRLRQQELQQELQEVESRIRNLQRDNPDTWFMAGHPIHDTQWAKRVRSACSGIETYNTAIKHAVQAKGCKVYIRFVDDGDDARGHALIVAGTDFCMDIRESEKAAHKLAETMGWPVVA